MYKTFATKFSRLASLLFLSALSAILLQPIVSARPQAEKDSATKLLAYDRSIPFDLKEVTTTEQDGVTIRDINYAAYASRHGRIKAFIVRPKGKGPFAGVVFFHWLGEVKSDRTEFLDEAIVLAKQGAVSLLIQGYFPWSQKPIDGPTDRQQVIDQAIEVRRALDLLLIQSEVDKRRIGYVGHDYGAMYGSIAAGVEKRVKAYVFMAAIGNFSDWSLKYWPTTAAKGEAAYREAITPLDPERHVARAAPARLLFQFANNDKYIPKTLATAFFDKASEPKQVKWYDAIHDLNVPAAQMDRRLWLTTQLGLTPIPQIE
jgi:dienelactone hydrolase